MLPISATALTIHLLLAGSGAMFTEAAERVALSSGWSGARLEVNPLSAVVVLHLEQAPTIRDVTQVRSALCPRAEAQGHAVVLHCVTRRLLGRLQLEHGHPFLELRQSRGVPWSESSGGPPFAFLEPSALGLGTCAGPDPAAIGECQLRDGHLDEARTNFDLAVTTEGAPLAALRQGDLAARDGDLDGAVAWYHQLGSSGLWGRLAQTRLCSLANACDAEIDFDLAGFPAPMRTEVELTEVRYLAFSTRPIEAAARLAERLHTADAQALAVAGRRLIRQVALEALRSPEGREREALALYLALPDRNEGPLAADLARAAAELGASMGAPAFGANLLAATMDQAEPDDVGPQLHRAAELYLAANDRVRAEVIADYARWHLSAKARREGHWDSLFRGTAPSPADVRASKPPPLEERELALDEDLAAAALARARVRLGEGTAP